MKKLPVTLMSAASIQEKGTLTTLLGITFPQHLAHPCGASTPEQQHPHRRQRSPSTQPQQAQLPSMDYSCQKHDNLLGRLYVRTIAGGKRESMCILKCRFCFLPPGSSPTMTFCCCCNTSICNTFPMDFSKQRQDSPSVQPGRPQQPHRGCRGRAIILEEYPKFTLLRSNQHLAIATLAATSTHHWWEAHHGSQAPPGLHSQLKASTAPSTKVLGYKNHHLLLPLAPQHLPFFLPLQCLKHHIQVTPHHNRTKVFSPDTSM